MFVKPKARERTIRKRILEFGGWGQRSVGALPEATWQEERANSITGGIGLLGAVLALGMLVQGALQAGHLEYLFGAVVYGSTLVFSYAATTLYHGVRHEPRKARLRVLDHCAVYTLIAGTYTPVAIAGLGGRTGWLLIGAVWALAGIGILFKLRYRFRFPGTSVLIYLLMGWLGAVTLRPVLEAVGSQGFLLLTAGGLAYTIGTIFFGAKRLPYHHAVWHVLVILGSGFHFLAISGYVLTLGA